jgi:hypothetical protein
MTYKEGITRKTEWKTHKMAMYEAGSEGRPPPFLPLRHSSGRPT